MKPNHASSYKLAALLLSLGLLLFASPFASANDETALDRYVAQPDAVYGWKLADTITGEGYTAFVLDLTSQTWRSKDEVDRDVWTHKLTIVRPDNPRPGTGFLYIGGGDNDDRPPTRASERAVALALGAKTVSAELGQVPNQPLSFYDSKDKKRYEDDLIAYTRVKYFETKDPNWLVRLAMVKSGVRAMDAITEFMASEAGGGIKVDQFMVAGGSKRGWTTWLVGAVDPRVVAIAPLVIDCLNTEPVTRHHYEAYGFFSTALNDYVRHGLFPDKVGSQEYREIMAIEDPYNYRNRERMKIPKYVVNASGDQYFLPDNAQFYFPELQAPKYLRYVENAKHNLAGSDARESIEAFYQTILDGKPLPKFSWTMNADKSITLTVEDKPKEVVLWQATNPEARDFRLDIIGKAWTSTPLKETKPNVYTASVTKPEKGFTAFFIQLVYENGSNYPLKFTTETSVVPDIKPYTMPTTLSPEERAKMMGRRGE